MQNAMPPVCAPFPSSGERLGPQPRSTTRLIRSPFGAHIHALRIERGQTVIEAAAQIGLHHCHLSHLECGYTHPRRDTCDRIAKAYGVDEDALWETCNESRRTFGRSKQYLAREKGAQIKGAYSVPEKVWKWIEAQAALAPSSQAKSQFTGRILRNAYAQATGDWNV